MNMFVYVFFTCTIAVAGTVVLSFVFVLLRFCLTSSVHCSLLIKMLIRKISDNFLRQSLFRPTGIIRLASKREEKMIDMTEAGHLEKTLNNVTLLGRVGSEPVKKGTELHPVVIFSLATHTNYRYESGEMSQKTDWHRVCVFKPGLRDTVFNYLRKGQRVHVNGRISYGSVTEDNTTKASTSIIADDVIFFSSPSGA